MGSGACMVRMMGNNITEYIADDSDGPGGEGKFRSRGWSVSREEFARLGSVVVATLVVLLFGCVAVAFGCSFSTLSLAHKHLITRRRPPALESFPIVNSSLSNLSKATDRRYKNVTVCSVLFYPI